MRNRSATSTLTAIGEVGLHVGQLVNVIGVVVEFSFPRKSKGSDFVSILKIVDDSPQRPQLSVHIFTQAIHLLPLLKSHADLIILHNLTIEHHSHDTLTATFNKKISSFALFPIQGQGHSNDFSSYQTVGTFSLSWPERNRILHLRDWWPNAHFDSGQSPYLLSIKDFSTRSYFDLVCQVLHVSYDVQKGRFILFVWDGTDTPSLNLDYKLKDEQNDPIPLQIESVPLGRDVLRKFHHVGTVLRVIADESHKSLDQNFEGVGKWVRIRNMSNKVLAGMWCGSLGPSSKIRFLADDDRIVLEYKRSYSERISRHGCLPLWSSDNSLTEIDCNEEKEGIELMTLRGVLTLEMEQQLCEVVVRVVAIYPVEAKESCCLLEQGAYRMTLEDPTARIHACLRGEEVVKFRNGLGCEMVWERMKKLLGVPAQENEIGDGGFARFPPFVKCCIYATKKEDNARTYGICHTRLK